MEALPSVVSMFLRRSRPSSTGGAAQRRPLRHAKRLAGMSAALAAQDRNTNGVTVARPQISDGWSASGGYAPQLECRPTHVLDCAAGRKPGWPRIHTATDGGTRLPSRSGASCCSFSPGPACERFRPGTRRERARTTRRHAIPSPSFLQESDACSKSVLSRAEQLDPCRIRERQGHRACGRGSVDAETTRIRVAASHVRRCGVARLRKVTDQRGVSIGTILCSQSWRISPER